MRFLVSFSLFIKQLFSSFKYRIYVSSKKDKVNL